MQPFFQSIKHEKENLHRTYPDNYISGHFAF